MAKLTPPPDMWLLISCRVFVIASPISIMFYTFFMKMQAYDACKITICENNDLVVWITSVVLAVICVYGYDNLHTAEVLYLEKVKNGK